jgi:tetratricopeptide (TPR) repeat protein
MAMGAVLMFCVGVAEASLFSDLLMDAITAQTEERDIQQAPDCKLSVDEALARSIELLSDGRQAEAEDLIKSAVKTYRNDVRILFAKGVLERSRWDKEAADVWFTLAREAKGNKTLSQAAWISTQLDRHRLVEENIAELIRLSNENPDEIYLLWLGAIQCREQERRADISSVLEREMAELGATRYEMLLSKFRIGPVLLHQSYANLLDDLKEYEKSLEHRILAVSMEAKGWSLDGLAFTLYKLEKYDWSNAVYARILRQNPYNETYWVRWGNTLNALKHYEEAEEKYWEALRIAPNKGWIWDKLAKHLDSRGKYEEMFKAYDHAAGIGYD